MTARSPATDYAADAADTVGYLGPPGTFTEQSVILDPALAGLRRIPLASTEDVVGAVATGRVAVGVLPWENSVAGLVGATADVLSGVGLAGSANRVQLRRDLVIPVRFALYGRAEVGLDGVSVVASHPHALIQCQDWLSRRLPHAGLHPVASTAAALQAAAEDRTGRTVAVAPADAPVRPGQTRIATGIADVPDAETRFVVFGREAPGRTGADRTVLACFQPADHPGSLLSILEPFAVHGIDLLRIGSRPTRTGMGRYYFVLECAGHPRGIAVRSALRALAARGVRRRVLGTLAGAEPYRLADGPAQRSDGPAQRSPDGHGHGPGPGPGHGRPRRSPRRPAVAAVAAVGPSSGGTSASGGGPAR
jgi:prephenate dehydratase